ncbi:MAG: hypothetical protein Q9202_001720 [Teloschistes flavicans]
MLNLPPPPNISQTYNHLLSLLHPSPPAVLELDILPSSSFPSLPPSALQNPSPHHILHENNSIAIPKPLLLQCHLHALSLLFAPPAPVPPTSKTLPHAAPPSHAPISQQHDEEEEEEERKYLATSIILLQEPTHLTAANLRKTHLLALSRHLNPNPSLTAAITQELHHLTSLLTSPLYKHAKSSTLWSHRLWILRTFPAQYISTHMHDRGAKGGRGGGRRRRGARWWGWGVVAAEMDIVMQAGERHARNYYAWNYARDVVRWARTAAEAGRGHAEELAGEGMRGMVGLESDMEEEEEEEWKDRVAKVHRWCLAHPRDISGWSFLVFLLDHTPSSTTRTSQGGRTANGEEAEVAAVEQKRKQEMMTIRDDIFARTQGFVRKYDWRGESIEWFLKSSNESISISSRMVDADAVMEA